MGDLETVKIFNNIITSINNTDKVISYFRRQNYDAALRTGTLLINQLNTLIELLFSNTLYFNNNSNLIQEQSVMGIFGSLLEAQENKDYVLLADLYEISLLPFLINIQEYIIENEGFIFDESKYKINLKTLEEHISYIKSYSSMLCNPLELFEKGYSVEYTSCGLMTLAIIDNGKKHYMHSNSRVMNEAHTLANSWYEEDKNEYIIYGLSLGYHIRALTEIDSNVKIEVYESDINIINLACAFSDNISIIKNPNIKLIYDPDCLKLITRISNIGDNSEFVIHYPSLRNIKNKTIKEKLDNYFIQYSSIKNQRILLNGNFNNNILNFDGVVDELKDEFQGKDLYIVAAGPSLDNNFHQLKKVGNNGIILATGTVFRKLLLAGITPNYVIVTDGNPRVYAQIKGVEDCNIPMLFLSTAYSGFAKNYKGKKYIIFQKDFNKAEAYAEKNDFKLYRTGGSVSTTALDIGIRLNCNRIIFLGLDLAFTNNYVHATGTSRRDLANTEDLRQVEDIYGNLIYTSRNLGIYRKWIESRINEEPKIEFIDATEGGAKINGMKIMPLEAVINNKKQEP